ncbi:ergothioneine biosynthesis glutamate--cysteine ligase EgtA [Mycobacterium sp. 236(2023)]|uniref:ergothioneine biosynthesis glutamate--cysteine ligase EgtA n=1 Tax=Mycobacterium sp. 236(2023) TaxID=3038163 RepID=UPI0024152E46|nr:ergothioneine biosynthesis glutamate--cysteine ligase EgtA [Mycobacterium sp. 236(2023)]MDG4665159.1 ergothioneine biosynthesis glutamate--cysteine ligase EgtA [Mycobacterium sp. 236(2023)]
MAHTMASDGAVEHCRAPLSSAEAAAQHIADACLKDGPVGPVGLEIEAHCYDMSDPSRRPGWTELTETIAGLPALPGGSLVTVEPGGAVELSGPPMADTVSAISAMASDRALLRGAFAQAGLGLVLLGADPLRPAERVNPGARYAAMERFFRDSGTGEAGGAMMTSTASVQVNLEAGPQSAWAERVRLAHALGPTMIAITANSPVLGGRFTGWRSTRQLVWSQLDSARSGPILGDTADDPASDWARYALRAPVMLVHNPDATAVTEWVPFADWADGRVLLGDRRPTIADLEYHLTTLFPPVRPRGFLEIRYLDSVPDSLWPAVVFTLAALLDDPAAADIAAEATESVATAWDRAAQLGLEDRRLHEAATRCVQAAAERVPAGIEESMSLLMRSVEQGRSPADDFADRVVTYGIEHAVTQLARGEL